MTTQTSTVPRQVPRSLLSLRDLTDDDIAAIVRRGCELAAEGARRRRAERTLDGAVLGVYFGVTSTRTRTAFTTGALRLGASVVTYGPNDLQTNTGETLDDTGRVFAGMLDGVVARTAGRPEELRGWAAEGLAVINAMTQDEHPTQALADLTTLTNHFGELSGLRLLYVGEGNNTAAALALALARVPAARLVLATPPGHGVEPAVLGTAQRTAARCGSSIVEQHDLRDLPGDIAAVYTTRWCTTGTTKGDPRWQESFTTFRVDARLMSRWPDAVFLHDLPAHRGQEVTGDVLDGPRSLAFAQAATKMWSAMAVLEWCLAPPRRDVPASPLPADGVLTTTPVGEPVGNGARP